MIRILREALASAIAQPVASLVAMVMVAGMCCAVLLTQGRSVGAQEAVIRTLDDVGTRSLVVRAQDGAGLDSSALDRLAGVSTIDWAGAFGAAVDASNTAVPGGARVAVRNAYGVELRSLGVHEPGLSGGAYASPQALQALGMAAPAGSITTVDGVEIPVVGSIRVPDHLSFLEPLVLVPIDSAAAPAPVNVLVVVATTAADVAGLTRFVPTVLNLTDPGQASLETSQALASLRNLIDSQLGGAGRALTVVIFSVTAVLVAAILTALVMMRRRDYGRRRALGASQRLIIGLVVSQTAMLSTVGAITGSTAAFIVLAATGDPQPPIEYFLAISLLAAATGTTASLPPAVAAARRDPARELRVA